MRRASPHQRSVVTLLASVLLAGLVGCKAGAPGPAHDRPFPIGQASDAFWETQQTNAEAADFIFYDHEFTGDTAELAPQTKRHLEAVALRWEHVPFPVVIEQSLDASKDRRELDQSRHKVICEHLARMGIPNPEHRVVVADAFARGFTAMEGERTYYSFLGNQSGGGGRFGGGGGTYR